MAVMYSYDQVLTDVRQVYEQLTGLPPPKLDLKNPRYPLPGGVDPVSLVQKEISYLNLLMLNTGISLRLSKIPTWAPNSEISETPGEYIIDVELAGVDQADVTVQHLNNILVVRGTRRFHKKSEEAHCHSSERKYGTFERYFALPYYLQPENLKLEFSNGVLEIVIPRGERSGDGKA